MFEFISHNGLVYLAFYLIIYFYSLLLFFQGKFFRKWYVEKRVNGYMLYVVSMIGVYILTISLLALAWYVNAHISISLGIGGVVLVAMPAIYSLLITIPIALRIRSSVRKAFSVGFMILLAIINLAITLSISAMLQKYFIVG